MIDKKPEKIPMNIDLKKITSFLDVLQKYFSRLYDFFRDNKNNSKIMLLIALLTSGLAIYFGIQLYNDIEYLNGKSSELNNLSSYDMHVLDTTPITQPIIKNSDTITDLLQENQTAK